MEARGGSTGGSGSLTPAATPRGTTRAAPASGGPAVWGGALMLICLLPASARAQGVGAAGGRALGSAKALAPIELVTPVPFDSAVAHGTRTRTGAPGARYWQNASDYDIRATITPQDSMLRGEETVTYRNNSPDTLRAVVFHLYQNLMGPYAAREQPVPGFTDGLVIDELRAGDQTVAVPDNLIGEAKSPGSARIRGTIMVVPLATPIPAGSTGTFHVRWHFTIPPEWAPRMGMQDATTAQIAQWYPQIAVYDDVHGWDAQQYTGTGEFYLDYGHFRYSITLPAGYIVGGTGTLTNPEDVLTPAERDALRRAAATSDVVHVVGADDFGPGRATAGTAGSMLTWTFDADSVRDVAFSFGDHYLWDATSAVVDSATGSRAAVHVFYRQGAPLFDRVWKMAQAALETHSSFMVPYPYPQLTETEGGSGGMEYPMTVFVQAYPDLYQEDMVTAHEIGHEWFPMLVGSNETRYGWQDEGLNTFDTFFATDAFLPDSMRRHGLDLSQSEYVSFVDNIDEDLQVMSPANAFGVLNSGYSIEAYAKPGVALWALRSILGPDAFDSVYRTYIRNWSYRHPTPYDFFNAMSSGTGQDLDAFFVPWFFSRGRLDQAVTAVAQSGGRVTVTVENRGQLYAPIDVTARLADGTTVKWREAMSVWYDGRREATTSHDVHGRVTRITLDAVHDFPDVNRANNVKAVQ